MVTKEQYSQALKDYCDHINNVKKHDDIKDKIKLVNEYMRQSYDEKYGNSDTKSGTSSILHL